MKGELFVNAANLYGETALMAANSPEQTALLLEAGANVDDVDEHGRTALMLAKSPETKLLLDAGANVKIVDRYGDTAPDFRQVTCTDGALLEAGQMSLAVGIRGKTALMWSESLEQTKLLLIMDRMSMLYLEMG